MWLTYCAIRWRLSDRLGCLMSLNQMPRGESWQRMKISAIIKAAWNVAKHYFQKFQGLGSTGDEAIRRLMLISHRSKGWDWHLPINSPRVLQRRTLQSVDEVSTTWSSATTCRLDENEERWDEGQHSWQDELNHRSSPAPDISALLISLHKTHINEETKETSYCFWCDVYVTYPVTLLVWARQTFLAESI